MKMSGEKAIHRQELERGLLTQKISRLFLKYTIPGVAGLLFLGIQSVIDGVILGRFVGANALASVNLILPCYSLMTALSIVIGVGCQTLIGINLGRSDRQEANNAITTSFLFLGGISVLIRGLIYIFAGDIARMLGANDVLVTGAVDYIRSLVPFFPLLSLMFLGDYMIKAMGHPLYAMIVMGSTVLINIGLDLLFIPVMGLGIKGAGLATGLAFTLGALFNIPRMFQRGQVVAVQRGRFRWPLVWNALYNGSSEGISELSAGITIFLFNITMMRYLGEDGVAAFTAINYILFIATTVFLGISDGIIPIISYNFGMNNLQRVAESEKTALLAAIVCGVVVTAVFVLFPETLVGFFLDPSTTVAKLAINGFPYFAAGFLCFILNLTGIGYFQSVEGLKPAAVFALLRGAVLLSAAFYVMPKLLGTAGIWLSMPVSETVTALMMGLYCLMNKRQKA